jgi:hypothetical protein
MEQARMLTRIDNIAKIFHNLIFLFSLLGVSSNNTFGQ